MGRARLDPTLMAKLAKRLGKPNNAAINKLVYARASRQDISSEAALIRLAKEHHIGTARYQARLDPAKQAEIRHISPSSIAPLPRDTGRGVVRAAVRGRARSPAAELKATIRSLLQDDQLYGRSGDLLAARQHFDLPSIRRRWFLRSG